MYKVIKSKGCGANVLIENTDTMSSIIIGKLNTEITSTLSEKYELPNSDDEWDFDIDSETAKTLSAMAMKMKKPIRTQAKKTNTTTKMNKEVDAFDLIFGVI